ncbi:MAG: hypothetical protein KBT36_16630, partial [Kurthia sp.]|nr:hypothetical protein [Candidatus Kurthia equi]
MSWFKNLFNRITNEEEQQQHKNDEYNDNQKEMHEENYEEIYDETSVGSQAEMQHSVEPESTSTSNFKFPLLRDEQEMPYNHIPEQHTNDFVNNEPIGTTPLRLRHQDVASPKKKEEYSPFGSRPQARPYYDTTVSRENYNPFANSVGGRRKEAIRPAVELPQAAKKTIPSFEERKRLVQETLVVEPVVEAPPKKKFVPTDVPSPVYGFKKPTNPPIHTKLVQERLEVERNKNKGTIANQLIKERIEKERRLAPSLENKDAHQEERVEEVAPIE